MCKKNNMADPENGQQINRDPLDAQCMKPLQEPPIPYQGHTSLRHKADPQEAKLAESQQ